MLPKWALFLSPAGWSIDIEAFNPLAVVLLLVPLFVLLAQLAISVLVYRFPYRSIDIDDVLRVFAGAVCGYGALRAVACAYRRLGWARGARLPVWDHMHAVLLATRSAHDTKALRPDA